VEKFDLKKLNDVIMEEYLVKTWEVYGFEELRW